MNMVARGARTDLELIATRRRDDKNKHVDHVCHRHFRLANTNRLHKHNVEPSGCIERKIKMLWISMDERRDKNVTVVEIAIAIDIEAWESNGNGEIASEPSQYIADGFNEHLSVCIGRSLAAQTRQELVTPTFAEDN